MLKRLREDIASIIARDPAARFALEVLTCYPGLHAVLMHSWAHWLWIRDFKWLARLVSHFSRSITGIEIHPGAVLGRRVFIDHGFGTVIGETAIVGDDCTIYQGVTLGGTSLAKGAKRHPTLERGVIVGAGAKVLGNFTVGAGAKVGPNAVVVKEVPPGVTALGNPARFIYKNNSGSHHGVEATKPSFAAYGLIPNGDDPLVNTVRKLSEQLAIQDHHIAIMVASLCDAGINVVLPSNLDQFMNAAEVDLQPSSAPINIHKVKKELSDYMNL